MAGRVTIVQLSGVNASAGAVVNTAAEAALLAPTRTTLRAFFDAKTTDADANGAALALRSRKLAAGGAEQQLTPTSTASAPKLIDVTNGQKGLLMGLTALGGTVIAGDGNRAMIGASPFTLPNTANVPDDFILMWLGAHAANQNGTIWATNDLVNPITGEFTTVGQDRTYSKRSATAVLLQGTAAANDGALHLWTWRYTKATSTMAVFRDGVQITSGTLALTQAYIDLSIRFGAVPTYSNGTTAAFNGMEGYMEMAALFSGGADADRNAFKAVVSERHPALVLA